MVRLQSKFILSNASARSPHNATLSSLVELANDSGIIHASAASAVSRIINASAASTLGANAVNATSSADHAVGRLSAATSSLVAVMGKVTSGFSHDSISALWAVVDGRRYMLLGFIAGILTAAGVFGLAVLLTMGESKKTQARASLRFQQSEPNDSDSDEAEDDAKAETSYNRCKSLGDTDQEVDLPSAHFKSMGGHTREVNRLFRGATDELRSKFQERHTSSQDFDGDGQTPQSSDRATGSQGISQAKSKGSKGLSRKATSSQDLDAVSSAPSGMAPDSSQGVSHSGSGRAAEGISHSDSGRVAETALADSHSGSAQQSRT